MASKRYLDRIQIIQGRITEQDVDAIVTLLPVSKEYSGSLNQHIAESAGAEFKNFVTHNIIKPRVGDIFAVPGFDLPCKHIFFCIVPVWKDEWSRHHRQLVNASRTSMELARRMSLKTIAFPPLGSSPRAFPKKRAARFILQGIVDRMDDGFDEVRMVCRTPQTVKVFEERLGLMRLS